MDEVLRDLAVIGEELFGVFGQAVAAVAEGRVVVVVADARVEADAVDDLFGVQAVGGGVGVEFVEVGDAHGEVGVGEEFDGFGFGAIGEQGFDVLFDGTLFEEGGEGFGALAAFAHDDA